MDTHTRRPRTRRPLSSTRSVSIRLCVLHVCHRRFAIVIGAAWLVAAPVGPTAALRRRHRQRPHRRRHRRTVVPRRRRHRRRPDHRDRRARRRDRGRADRRDRTSSSRRGSSTCSASRSSTCWSTAGPPSKILQGVTTEVTGEGSSIAPVNDRLIAGGGGQREALRRRAGLAHARPTTSRGSRSDRTRRSTSRRSSAPAASATT